LLGAIAFMVLGLVALTFGAEALVRGAARLAKAAGISSFIVGLTVVAFGTSAPELGGSVQAAFQGKGDLAVGNVVGSNIANICLILGVTAMVCPVPVRLSVVRREAPLMLAVCIFGALTMLGGDVSRLEGVALVVGLLGYTARAYLVGRREGSDDLTAAAAKELDEELASTTPKPLWWNLMLTAFGIALLVGGSKFLVGGAIDIAAGMGVPEAVIGLSMVAFGTSVPELWTSVYAALRSEADIAVGNILGSNVFNVLCVLGLTSLTAPDALPVEPVMMTRDVWVMLGVSAAVIPMMYSAGRINRIEGAMLSALYALYVWRLFSW